MSSHIGEVLAALGTCFDSLDVRWYLFGAQAAIFHGVARLTADVDVTVLPGLHSTGRLVSVMEANGFGLRVTATDDFVARTRVLPFVHSATRLPVDVVLAGPGIEERFLDRAELHVLEGVRVPIATVEDLVTMKILAGRPQGSGRRRRHAPGPFGGVRSGPRAPDAPTVGGGAVAERSDPSARTAHPLGEAFRAVSILHPRRTRGSAASSSLVRRSTHVSACRPRASFG